jgi:hypothetical protein
VDVFLGDTIAQLAHVGWGIALVLLLTTLHVAVTPAAVTVAAFALVKEFIESKWGAWEPIQPWASGAKDVAFWFVGIAIALAVLRLR